MKTEKVYITNKELGMQDALQMTEKIGTEQGLEKKQLLHLRLLSEELFGMLKGITGEIEADYWVGYEGKKFDIHLKSEIKLTDEMREQFLSASSSGKNAAEKGFMGKLRVMIAEALISNTAASGFSLGLMSMASPNAQNAALKSYQWSMEKYKTELKKKNDEDSWDELEKSIVANIADDVSVSIVGSDVEIIVTKAF